MEASATTSAIPFLCVYRKLRRSLGREGIKSRLWCHAEETLLLLLHHRFHEALWVTIKAKREALLFYAFFFLVSFFNLKIPSKLFFFSCSLSRFLECFSAIQLFSVVSFYCQFSRVFSPPVSCFSPPKLFFPQMLQIKLTISCAGFLLLFYSKFFSFCLRCGVFERFVDSFVSFFND